MNEVPDVTSDDEPLPRSTFGRRRLLATGGGLAAAGVFLAACGGDDDDDAGSGSSGGDGDESTTTAGNGGDDLATAQFAASLEVLAVNTYQAALDAATAGSLGDVPPAVAEFATTAKDHHQAALDAWNTVITDAGETEVTEPPADLEQTVNDQFAAVTDVAGAAELALLLEQTAAATYLAAVGTLGSSDAIALAGSLDYVDQQHAAVLLFVLGREPVPETFQSTDMAASPA